MIFVADVQRAVAGHYGLPIEAMVEPDGQGARNRRKVYPRQVAMLLALRLTEQGPTNIGRRFGRDHSTVLHACEAVEKRSKNDPQLRTALRTITLELVRS